MFLKRIILDLLRWNLLLSGLFNEVMCNKELPCQPEEFKCISDGRCIEKDWFCDGETDCSDGSDEIIFDTENNMESGIGCRSWRVINVSCLLPYRQKDKAMHVCNINSICPKYHYKCLDGQKCVRDIRFCDGHSDCSDSSDEIAFNSTYHNVEHGISCRSFTDDKKYCLLPKNHLEKHEDYCRKDVVCSAKDSFRCVDKLSCIWKDSFCDGSHDCRDGSDDVLYNSSKHTSADGIPCMGWLTEACLLPAEYVCDGIFHCKDRADECNCETSDLYCNGVPDCSWGIDECFCGPNSTKLENIYIDKNCFRCLDGSQVIPNSKLCDGLIHCSDLSDECICNSLGASFVHPLCDRIVTGHEDKCSGKFRCDERDSDENCIDLNKICDGRLDCSSGKDELHCEPNNHACAVENDVHQSGVPKCDYTCRFQRGRQARACDGKPTCNSLDEECNNCLDPPGFCDFMGPILGSFRCVTGGYVPGYKVCDGIPHCPNEEDELYCPDRFYCKNSSAQHIPVGKICDFVNDCEDQSDESDCADSSYTTWGRTQYTHFYCHDGGETKYLNWKKQVCDGNSDCASGIDECQDCTEGIFSDDNALISSKPLVPFLWIISIIAIFGNIVVIYHSITRLMKKEKGKNDVLQKSQHILMLNLAVADFLVGVYTSSMCFLNIHLSTNGYCQIDQDWRSGNGCSAMGIILMIGSEESVFALTIITCFRLKSVMRPFARHSIRLICVCMLISWGLAITLAVIPLAEFARDSFIESIWYAHNPLVTRIDRKNVQGYISRMLTFKNVNSSFIDTYGKGTTWDLMEAVIRNLNPEYVPARRFGYYSSHGVCLPRLFPDPDEHGSWGFSLSIILINFLSFIFIFAGYVAIYMKSTKSRTMMTSISKRTTALQRNITRIVLTDFLCWMPICIMALLQLVGVHIPVQAYVPVGTILIPINSAINPFIYSGAPDWLWQRVSPYVRRIRSHIPFRRKQKMEVSPRGSFSRIYMESGRTRMTEVGVMETPM